MTQETAEQKIKRLANYIRLRKEQGEHPYTILLGAGASVDSRYPTARAFVDEFLTWAVAPVEGLREEEKRALFDEHWAKAGEATINAFIKRVLPPVWPSRGYQHLAALMYLMSPQGCFRTILTTNVDTLLDQSIANADPSLRQHQVIIFPDPDLKRAIDRATAEQPPIKVLKLHGDLRSGRFCFTKAETERFAPELANVVKNCLRKGVIIVGYGFEDEDVAECFKELEGDSPKCPVVYVTRSGGLPRALEGHKEQIEIIRGELADFDQFFSKLFFELSGIDPRLFATYSSRLEQSNLTGLTWERGQYWAADGCLVLGDPSEESVLRVSPVWLGLARVAIELDVKADASRDRTDWFGLLLAAGQPYWDNGYLVYLRANGSLELRVPGGQIIVMGTVGDKSKDWLTLKILLDKDTLTIGVSSQGKPLLEHTHDLRPRTEGYMYLWGYYTRSLVGRIHVTPVE